MYWPSQNSCKKSAQRTDILKYWPISWPIFAIGYIWIMGLQLEYRIGTLTSTLWSHEFHLQCLFIPLLQPKESITSPTIRNLRSWDVGTWNVVWSVQKSYYCRTLTNYVLPHFLQYRVQSKKSSITIFSTRCSMSVTDC